MKRRGVVLALILATLCQACDVPNRHRYREGKCGAVQGGDQLIDKPAGSLRVVTANLWGIPYWSPDVETRFTEFARRINENPTIDVVGLQEMWDDQARANFLTAVADQYPYRVDFQGQHRRSGLMLLSRLPFASSPVFVPYRQTGKWWKPWTGEWWAGKGIGAVQVKAADSEPWVFVTHLHACYFAGGGAAGCDEHDEYADIRMSQIAALRTFVNETAGSHPAIIVGDFNFTNRSRYMAAVTGDVRLAPYDPPWTLVPETDAPRGRIDHIWLRPAPDMSWQFVHPAVPYFTDSIALPDGATIAISDHCPIVATVEARR